MTKNHGTAVVALLVVLAAIMIHRSYVHKAGPTRIEYRATEAPTIDLGALQRAGDEGWNCTPIPIFEGTAHHYVMFCRREVH